MRSQLVALSIVIFASYNVTVFSHREQTSTVVRSLKQRYDEVARRDGLRAAARLAGEYIVFQWINPGIGVPMDFATVAIEAEFVVVGLVVRSQACLVDNERSVATELEILPTEVLRDSSGAQRARRPIFVAIPGGRVQFADGTAAEIQVNLHRPVEGGTYLLALRQSTPRSGVSFCSSTEAGYVLAWRTESILELPQDGSAVRAANRTRLAEWFNGRSVEAVMEEVREQVRSANQRFPKPTSRERK